MKSEYENMIFNGLAREFTNWRRISLCTTFASFFHKSILSTDRKILYIFLPIKRNYYKNKKSSQCGTKKYGDDLVDEIFRKRPALGHYM